jgi:V/A-type H+-transporting ATPase subunit I
LIVLSVSFGKSGIFLGPIEFIGTLGNVLSYLRLAALGLASVYLSNIANSMSGLFGSVLVGVIIAILLHSINLIMGMFSPTIQSLRLNYVEFFRRFFEGGGNPYNPFRKHLV